MLRSPLRILFPLLLLPALLVACSAPGDAPLPAYGPGVPAGTWSVVPLGDAVCADGSAYRAYLRPGADDGLLVFFAGGGACWDPYTCGDPLDDVDDDSGFYFAAIVDPPERQDGEGILAYGDPRNPFGDWSTLLLPYCTGDLHWGDAQAIYDRLVNPDVTVRHRGARNVRAALAWAAAELSEPERVALAGCSAGAYGSALWTAAWSRVWPEVPLVQVGDAGVGVVSQVFVSGEDGPRRWGVEGALADSVPALDPAGFDPYRTDLVERIYAETLSALPELRMAQHSTDLDAVQTLFWDLQLGGDPAEFGEYGAWGERAAASLDRLAADSERFASYLSRWDPNDDRSDGTGHCLLDRSEVFDYEDGAVVAWLEALLAGAAPTVRD